MTVETVASCWRHTLDARDADVCSKHKLMQRARWLLPAKGYLHQAPHSCILIVTTSSEFLHPHHHSSLYFDTSSSELANNLAYMFRGYYHEGANGGNCGYLRISSVSLGLHSSELYCKKAYCRALSRKCFAHSGGHNLTTCCPRACCRSSSLTGRSAPRALTCTPRSHGKDGNLVLVQVPYWTRCSVQGPAFTTDGPNVPYTPRLLPPLLRPAARLAIGNGLRDFGATTLCKVCGTLLNCAPSKL